MSLWLCEKLTIHISFNDSAAPSVYPHPYLYVQYHPYLLHWIHPYDLANPCVWIPGVRWSFPHTPCNVVYIEHNIVQSVLYFNIHVVMMYVLYTQTWITFVYSSNSFFPVFSPSSMGIPPSKLSISYTKLHGTIFTSNIFSSFQSSIHKDPPFKLSSFKTIVMMYDKADLILPTLYSSLQSWYAQGFFFFNITQTFFLMNSCNWCTEL